MSLEDVALAVGLPGKIGGRGSEIEAMVRRGEIDKVRACCEGDCLNVFVLYVWWALLSGRIDPAGCNASLQSLIDFLESERDVRLHLGAFLDRWRATSRPMPSFVPFSNSRFSFTTCDGQAGITRQSNCRSDQRRARDAGVVQWKNGSFPSCVSFVHH